MKKPSVDNQSFIAMAVLKVIQGNYFKFVKIIN